MASNIQNVLGKKVARATYRHSVHGLRSKARRQPFRSVTLLSVGAILGVLIGATAGWLVGRSKSNDDD
jgi:F0F1-type ATP synthase assembly protein I